MSLEDVENEKLKINLRGSVFVVRRNTLASYPNSRLSELSKTSEEYEESSGEYFFDVNPELFHYILDLYTTGQLHLPPSICSKRVTQILQFWKIDISYLEPCCWRSVYENDDDVETFNILDKMNDSTRQHCTQVEPKDKISNVSGKSSIKDDHTWKESFREIYEYPGSSLYAKVWFSLVLLMTFLSIVTFTVNTLPEARQTRSVAAPYNSTNPKIQMLFYTKTHPAVLVLDVIANVFLFVEIILRCICSVPPRWRFLVNPIHIFELLSIVSTIVDNYLDDSPLDYENQFARLFMPVFGCLYGIRVIRLLRLACFAREMKILGICLQSSSRELLFLGMSFGTFSLLFSTFIYVAEYRTPDYFANMFISTWWAVITMTTVGYGDEVPKSAFGLCIGTVAALCGILILAMPVAVLSSSFSKHYNCYKIKQRIQRK